MEIKIKKIKLVSINQRNIIAWQFSHKLKKTIAIITKSDIYKNSQSDLASALLLNLIVNKITPIHYTKNIEVKIEIWTYKDIDNCLKQILDVLALTKIIKNDRNIIKLIAIKHPVKRGTFEDLNITVIGE